MYMPAGFSDQSDSEDDYFVDSKRQTVENRSSDDTLIKNVSDSDASTEETNLLMAKSDLIQAIEAGSKLVTRFFGIVAWKPLSWKNIQCKMCPKKTANFVYS